MDVINWHKDVPYCAFELQRGNVPLMSLERLFGGMLPACMCGAWAVPFCALHLFIDLIEVCWNAVFGPEGIWSKGAESTDTADSTAMQHGLTTPMSVFVPRLHFGPLYWHRNIQLWKMSYHSLTYVVF